MFEYGQDLFDPSAEAVLVPDTKSGINALGYDPKTTAIIRTSDRISFKRCRRRWGWQSHLKAGLGPKESQNPLWFGTGIHFALEDYHGYNRYGSPVKAFEAYTSACHKIRQRVAIPAMFDELKELGIGMMQYYLEWEEGRPQYHTLWLDGKPQVELRILIPVPFNPQELYPNSPYTSVLYSLTIDRVCIDEEGTIFLFDYKTAKQIQTQHFLLDPQISVYYWAATHLYKHPIGGFVYQQHRKDIPEAPRMLSTGRLSVDQRMLTTHKAYRKQLVNIYGKDIQKWPEQNLTFLNWLANEEQVESDKFIRRDKIFRNEFNFEAEGTKILLELEDMLNPDLPLYPNPTRDCTYLCPFHHACASMDDGSDWAWELELQFAPRAKEQDEWRNYLPAPEI